MIDEANQNRTEQGKQREKRRCGTVRDLEDRLVFESEKSVGIS